MGEPNLEMAVKRRPDPQSQAYDLALLQIPKDCRIAGKSDNDKPRASKWPLDPAPVVEFKLHDGDPSRSYLHSPFWFCSAALEPAPGTQALVEAASSQLAGCLVSSLHKVKLQDNIEHGLFIFGDLHAKTAGEFRLRFTLYELRSNADSTYVTTLTSKLSDTFRIHSGKSWPGQAESTGLSRHLCDSGVKLRIRKETSKRKAQSQDWSSDKRAAISSLSLPMPMGPPPSHRRRLTGENITPDQVKFAGGLGIKGAMDREQYTNTQNQLRSGYSGLGDYRSQPDPYPSLSAPYLTQSTAAYDNRSSGLYNTTPYATLYMTEQVGYSGDATQYPRGVALPSSLYTHRSSSIQDQPYPATSGSGYSLSSSKYGSTYPDRISSHSGSAFTGLSPMYENRSAYTESGARYDEGRSDRSLLLTEPTGNSNSRLPGWTPTSLSAIDPPRFS